MAEVAALLLTAADSSYHACHKNTPVEERCRAATAGWWWWCSNDDGHNDNDGIAGDPGVKIVLLASSTR